MITWSWFHALYPPQLSLTLALALAVNWTWGRSGGSIQSEPLFLLLSQCAMLTAFRVEAKGGIVRIALLGFWLGTSILTRHVGACLALAVSVNLALRRRLIQAITSFLVATVVVFPWVGWMLTTQRRVQTTHFARGFQADRIAYQLVFYIQRLPDQIVGPIVEVGTVFRRSPALSMLVNVWGGLTTSLLVWGWLRCIRSRRRRLVGLTALTTLAVLLVWPYTEAGRFLIPLVPLAIIGGVEGVGPLLAWWGWQRPRFLAAFGILILSVPYPIYAIVSGRAEAQRLTYRDFDAACAWLAGQSTPLGPIMTRHPGEVFWLTGRQALEPPDTDPQAIADAIERFGAAFLLIDELRYARATESPLIRFVERYPDRVRCVWSQRSSDSTVTVYVVDR